MAAPSAVVGGVYASNIISLFDIDKPERMNKLFRKRGDQGAGYMLLLKSLGFTEATAQDLYTHTEDDWFHQTFTEQIGVGPSAPGATQILTLSPADVYTDPTGGVHIYPRLWDTVMYPNEVTGQIIAINLVLGNWELTISPNVLADALPAVAATDTMIIISSAFSEGSTQPGGVIDPTYNYNNYTQIIKETLVATGTEMTNQKWFDVFEDGTGAKYYYLIGQQNTEYRLMLKQDGALLFQKPTDNPMIDPVTLRQNRTTEGLFPFIRRLGNTQPYVPGALAMSDYDTMARTFDREFAGRYICGLDGLALEQENENVFVNYLKNTNVILAQNELKSALFNDDEGLTLSVAFQTLVKGGRIFNFRKMGIFTHSKLYGAAGYKGPNYGVFMPMDKKKDKKTNSDVPSFGMRYKAFGDYNRMMEVWNQNGAGPGTKVIPEDLHNFYLRSNIGAQHIAGNQFVLLTPP